jgi:hypothetical protein
LATTASAIEVNAESTVTVYGAQCVEELHETFFSKCIDDIAGSLVFRNRNLREAQRELKCTQNHWCTNPPPYSYCWLNCRNARRLVLDDANTNRFLSVLQEGELEDATNACLATEALSNPCLGHPTKIHVKLFF